MELESIKYSSSLRANLSCFSIEDKDACNKEKSCRWSGSDMCRYADFRQGKSGTLIYSRVNWIELAFKQFDLRDFEFVELFENGIKSNDKEGLMKHLKTFDETAEPPTALRFTHQVDGITGSAYENVFSKDCHITVDLLGKRMKLHLFALAPVLERFSVKGMDMEKNTGTLILLLFGQVLHEIQMFTTVTTVLDEKNDVWEKKLAVTSGGVVYNDRPVKYEPVILREDRPKWSDFLASYKNLKELDALSVSAELAPERLEEIKRFIRDDVSSHELKKEAERCGTSAYAENVRKSLKAQYALYKSDELLNQPAKVLIKNFPMLEKSVGLYNELSDVITLENKLYMEFVKMGDDPLEQLMKEIFYGKIDLFDDLLCRNGLCNAVYDTHTMKDGQEFKFRANKTDDAPPILRIYDMKSRWNRLEGVDMDPIDSPAAIMNRGDVTITSHDQCYKMLFRKQVDFFAGMKVELRDKSSEQYDLEEKKVMEGLEFVTTPSMARDLWEGIVKNVAARDARANDYLTLKETLKKLVVDGEDGPKKQAELTRGFDEKLVEILLSFEKTMLTLSSSSD